MADDARAGIEHLSADVRVVPPPPGFAAAAVVPDVEAYRALYRRSLDDPEGFWGDAAREELDWIEPFTKVTEGDFDSLDVRWFSDGVLNVSANCLDRHLGTWRRNKAALIWEGDDGTSRTFTYQQLHHEVSRFANVLRKKGVERGDRVAIYLPMIPELPIAMLACARIGAIHSVVFGGFSASALRERIQDCGARILVTADEGIRGGRKVALKVAADEALFECPSVLACIVVRRGAGDVDMEPGRDTWWHQEVSAPEVRKPCAPEPMGAEDPLFILYTSGSTGKPKGVLHTTAGYLLFAALSFKTVMDYRDEDVFWCTADIGWVTGHSYILYGPLAAGATSLMFEGVPTYPDPGRFWAVVEKYRVNTSTRRRRPSGRSCVTAPAGRSATTCRHCACSAPWESRSIPRCGTGTTRPSAVAKYRSSTPTGRRRPAAFSSRRSRARRRSSLVLPPGRSSACSPRSSVRTAAGPIRVTAGT
jgi:acetyl-CoA synthetase